MHGSFTAAAVLQSRIEEDRNSPEIHNAQPSESNLCSQVRDLPFGMEVLGLKNAWPFREAENLAVITLASILARERPILSVYHEAGPGGWQFLSNDAEPDMREARVVALSEMLEIDPSVAELADLPVGWVAWRQCEKSRWLRGELGGQAPRGDQPG